MRAGSAASYAYCETRERIGSGWSLVRMVKMILSYRFNPGKDKEPPKKEIKQYDKNLLKAFEKLSGGEKPIFKNQES